MRYLLLLVFFLPSCNELEVSQKPELDMELLLEMEDEVIMPLIKGMVIDLERNKLPYKAYTSIRRVIELDEASIKCARVDSFFIELKSWDESLSRTYDHEIDLFSNYQTMVVARSVDVPDEAVKTLLMAYLITVGSKLGELVNEKSISFDSLSYKTIGSHDSIQILPILHNETRRCLLVVDADSLGMAYDDIKLSMAEMREAESIDLLMLTCQGKFFTLKIK